MSSPLRQMAYRHRWIYDIVTGISALSVGGVDRLRGLGLTALDPLLPRGGNVLDLCCGSGEAAEAWIRAGFHVTGLDVSPKVLELAKARHPLMTCIEGLAEAPPCPPSSFDAIQISLALHEFPRTERQQVLTACLELLRPGGWIVVVDLHPAGPLLSLPQKVFCALFETETALALLEDDLPKQFHDIGFTTIKQSVMAGEALQRITARCPSKGMLEPTVETS